MFALITISNGVAVVQHSPSGHVYRFRPVHSGLWNRLTLDQVNAHDDAKSPPDAHASAALAFAEETATACCRAADEFDVPERAAKRPSLFALRRPRLSALT